MQCKSWRRIIVSVCGLLLVIVPGTVQSVTHNLSQSSAQKREEASISTPILQMRNLRHREVPLLTEAPFADALAPVKPSDDTTLRGDPEPDQIGKLLPNP